MGRPRKQRPRHHGSAWHWKQTDRWYDTLPGTKKRMPLFEDSEPGIRGKDDQESAEAALAKVKVAREAESSTLADRQPQYVVDLTEKFRRTVMDHESTPR